jgi:small-conductance mechanosensitive channel
MSSKISVVWCGFSFKSKFIIWSMSICTSGTFSIVRMLPLSFVVYLLIADWDKPRISAACFSLIPCFSIMVLAIRALIAGKTVWTPTSHGNSKIFHQFSYSVRYIYKYDACHTFYDACHDGRSIRRVNSIPTWF